MAGQCFAILGPSGCGKTTLLRIIAGLEQPDAGTVTIDGRDVTRTPPEKRPTAMVFQNYALFPHLTVAGNVAFGLRLRRKTRDEINRKVAEVLELVQLGGFQQRRIGELSGGQQQRVALARVLAVEPSVLLLDEPLSNLDASLRRATRSVIRQIQTELGLTMIYITHDQEEGMAISDQMALMADGRIMQSGPPRELFERPASVEAARFLGQRNIIRAIVRRVDTEGYWLALGTTSGSQGAILRVNHRTVGSAFKAGDRIWLAIKPDEVLLKKEDTSSEGWPARISLISYAGDHLEIEVCLSDNNELVQVAQDAQPGASYDAAPDWRRGDSVRLSLRGGAGLLYQRSR